MTAWKKVVLSVGAGALALMLGLNGAAAQQAPGTVSVDDLTRQLGLAADAQKQLAPEVDRLNKLLVQRAQLAEQSQDLWNQFADANQKIASKLTPDQQWRFAYWMHQTGVPHTHGAADWTFDGMGHMGHMMGMMMGYGPGGMGSPFMMMGPRMGGVLPPMAPPQMH